MSLDPITAVSDLAKTAIDKIWPDKSEQEKIQLANAFGVIQGQLQTNQEEAKSSSLFIAGWRPFIGWVCGIGCAWNWVGLKIALFVAALMKVQLNLQPADLSEMMPLLIGMLGLGAYRTYEKINNSEGNR